VYFGKRECGNKNLDIKIKCFGIMVFENKTPCSSVESVVHNFPDKPAGSRFGAVKA